MQSQFTFSQPETQIPSIADIAYLAGYFDGEGTVSIRVEKRAHGLLCFVLQLTIGSTDPRPLDWISRIFGGTVRGPLIRANTRHKPIYHWQAGAAQAGRMLTLMHPHLITKKAQAEIGLDLRRSLNQKGKMLSQEEIAHRQCLKNRLTELNRRGIDPREPAHVRPPRESNQKLLSYSVVSPDGVVHKGTNLKKFCESHNLTPALMHRVITGKRPHHRGWRLMPCESSKQP